MVATPLETRVERLSHQESPIAQWLERPTGIWKVIGSIPVGGSENSFSEFFDLRTLLRYFHFIQIAIPFIIIIIVICIICRFKGICLYGTFRRIVRHVMISDIHTNK